MSYREFLRKEEKLKIAASALFLNGSYQECSKYSCNICRRGVNDNEEFIWTSVLYLNDTDEEWNVCSYGNLAYVILYVAKFPERREAIEQLKKDVNRIARKSSR